MLKIPIHHTNTSESTWTTLPICLFWFKIFVNVILIQSVSQIKLYNEPERVPISLFTTDSVITFVVRNPYFFPNRFCVVWLVKRNDQRRRHHASTFKTWTKRPLWTNQRRGLFACPPRIHSLGISYSFFVPWQQLIAPLLQFPDHY